MTIGHLALVCDSGPGIGLGHLTRQLALAEAWVALRGTVSLTTPGEVPRFVSDRYRACGATRDGEVPHSADVIVVDSYRTSADSYGALRAIAPVVQVDDYAYVATRLGDATLDHNPGSESRYDQSTGGPVWSGRHFTLVRNEFADPNELLSDALESVYVSMGGTPDQHLLEQTIDQVSAALPGVRVLTADGDTADVALLMRQAQVAVSAAGSTCWELASLAIPAIVVPLAPNQEPVAAALAGSGAAISTDIHGVGDALRSLVQDPAARRRMSLAGRALVDGDGPKRVVTCLRSLLVGLRTATIDDAQQLLDWRNDPETRLQSFDGEPVQWDDHIRWMQTTLARPDRHLLVASYGGADVGQVRFDMLGAGVSEISFTVAPEARGNGLGPVIIRAGTDEIRRMTTERLTVIGWVKPDNAASMRSFDRSAFDRTNAVRENGVAVQYAQTQ